MALINISTPYINHISIQSRKSTQHGRGYGYGWRDGLLFWKLGFRYTSARLLRIEGSGLFFLGFLAQSLCFHGCLSFLLLRQQYTLVHKTNGFRLVECSRGSLRAVGESFNASTIHLHRMFFMFFLNKDLPCCSMCCSRSFPIYNIPSNPRGDKINMGPVLPAYI